MNNSDNLINVQIADNLKIAEDCFILSFEKKFEFLPGQVIYVGNEKSNVLRIYSISSGINEEVIKVLYNVNPEGRLTPSMSKLLPGDTIKVSKPFGKFIIPSGPAICIANGTGIAPFASLFFSGLYHEKIFVHGSRNFIGFYFQNQLLQMNEHYIRCCSGEWHPGCFYGRVTDYLLTQRIFHKNIKYYLCGSAEMVVEVRDILIKNEVPFGNILTEIYF